VATLGITANYEKVQAIIIYEEATYSLLGLQVNKIDKVKNFD
jgi:hypothetical protein